MPLAIDIVLIAVIALCAISGVRRGFIRTLMSIVTVITAGFGAWYFTPSLSLYLRSAYLEERITDPVAQTIKLLLGPSSNGRDTLPRLFLDMPDAFAGLLKRYGADTVAAQATASASPDATTALANFLAEPAVEMISDALAFILLFLGIALGLTIITMVLDMIFKLSVLSALNRTGGLALGLLCGAIYAWVIVFILSAAMPFLTQVLPNLFSPTTMSDTLVASWLCQYNPLTLLEIPLLHK